MRFFGKVICALSVVFSFFVAVASPVPQIAKCDVTKLISAVVDIVVKEKEASTLEKKDYSDGSGFIIDESGLIVTNCHVIDGAEKIKIILYDGTSYIAKVIGKDERSDVALLKIDSDTKLTCVKFSDSDSVNILDPVFAVGNPFGFGKTATSGIISFKGRNLSNQIAELGAGGDMVSYIQTDAAINYGNSGGPLFTYDGKVVGMITVFVSDGMHSTGINFAIPSNVLQKIINQLKEFGKMKRSWTGIAVSPLTKDVVIALGLGENFGCDIVGVEKMSPAEKAGVKVGDILVSVNNEAITESTNLEYVLNNLPLEEVVPVKIIRNGTEINLKVKVASRVDDGKYHDVNEANSAIEEIRYEKVNGINIGVTDLTNEYRQHFDIPSNVTGALIANVENENSEMSVGNIVIGVNQKRVYNVKELSDAINGIIEQKKPNVALYIYDPHRKQKQFYVAFKLTYTFSKK
jgi:serine protease Do